MIRVLYLLNHAGKAGTEAYVLSLADRLSGRIDPFLVYNEEGLLVQQLKDRGIPAYRLSMRHPYDLPAAFRLAALCRRLNIHIIHAQYLRENYIALLSRLLRPRTRVIYTNHFILDNNPLLRISNRLLSRLQAQVIAVCDPGRDRMIRNGVDPRRIRVIHNGVDPAYWGTRGPSSLRKEFGIPDDAMLLLCGSRFAYDKGHEYLISAIALLKNLAPCPFRFILANDGPFWEDRKKQAAELGLMDTVVFTGPRKDIKNLYDGCDIYVNSSWHEALSFAIIEAMAEGLPVVATRMGGNTDIIREDERNGLLVTYGEAPELAETLARLMADAALRRELSENGQRSVRDKFNLDIMAASTYNLYKKAISREV